jgi:hypothetical protein
MKPRLSKCGLFSLAYFNAGRISSIEMKESLSTGTLLLAASLLLSPGLQSRDPKGTPKAKPRKSKIEESSLLQFRRP